MTVAPGERGGPAGRSGSPRPGGTARSATRAVAPRRADDAELEAAVGDQVDDGLRVVHLERRRARPGCARWNSQRSTGTTTAAGPGRGADRELARERARRRRRPPRRASAPRAAAAAARRGRAACPASVGSTRRPERSSSCGAEPLLERAHLQRDRRLRDAEPLGRLREAAPLDDRAERRKLTRVHKQILSTCGRRAPVVASAHLPGGARTAA